MGNWMTKEPPPPVVLVPPLFERPHLATRSRMTESSYDLMFSKLARARLFDMYFAEAQQVLASLVLQPADDPRVDVTACVQAPTDGEALEGFNGEATFRWQREVWDFNNFTDITISSVGSPLRIRGCMFDANTGLGTWALVPVNPTKFGKVADDVIVGARYASTKFTTGTTFSPLQWGGSPSNTWLPKCTWICGKLGPITSGVQYKSLEANGVPWGSKGQSSFGDGSWSYAVDYGVGGKGPLDPSFNFCIEILDSSKLMASYYHHLVVQRRVKNPFELNEVVAITNYVDLGFEFEHTLETGSVNSPTPPPKMQVAGSWQANKNVQMKVLAGSLGEDLEEGPGSLARLFPSTPAKLGSQSSGLSVILKSWWQPSVTLSLAAIRDHQVGQTNIGFGVRVENFGGVSYERADPNYVMLTPTKQHLAEGLLKETGKRPMIHKDGASSLPSERLPADLRPPTDNIM